MPYNEKEKKKKREKVIEKVLCAKTIIIKEIKDKVCLHSQRIYTFNTTTTHSYSNVNSYTNFFLLPRVCLNLIQARFWECYSQFRKLDKIAANF